MKKQNRKWSALGRRGLASLLVAVMMMGFIMPVYATGDVTEPTEPVVTETTAPTVPETTAATQETTEPASSETSEPATSETTEPVSSETTEPASSETSEPATSETTVPASSETSDPSVGDDAPGTPDKETVPDVTVPQETTSQETVPQETAPENVETVITDEVAEVSGILPVNAELVVSEVTDVRQEILTEIAQAAPRAAKFSFRRAAPSPVTYHLWSQMYDIKIKNDNNDWQPEDTVKVTINDVNPQSFETIKIRHYLDTVEAVEAAIKNGTAQYYYAEGLSKIFPAETAAMVAVDPEMTDTLCYTLISSADGDVLINENGSITFELDSFSIISVESDYSTESTEVKTVKSTSDPKKFTLDKPIAVNDVIYLKWDKQELVDISGVSIADATDVRGVWAIAEGTDIIEMESFREIDIEETATEPFDKTYDYFFAKVKALKEGTAKLEFTYREGTQSQNRRVTLEVEIQVVGSNFWIEDRIATTGCLVPRTTRDDIVTYQWSKKHGTAEATIDPDALKDEYIVDNGVNVALDKGGMNATDYTANTYTVQGLDAGGNVVASADFVVKYGNEVLNGSFENTDVNYGVTGSTSIHAQFPNGYPNLYWQTTGTGAIRLDGNGNPENDYLGHDIEIFHDEFIGTDDTYKAAVEQGLIPAVGLCHSYDGYEEVTDKNSELYGMDATRTVEVNLTDADGNETTVEKTYKIPKRNSVYDGDQAAELNCEEYGSLYQDVITTPGATLSWKVVHTARFDDKYGMKTETVEKTVDGNKVEVTVSDKDADGNLQYTTGQRNHSVLQRDGTRRDHDYMCVIVMPTEHARKIITKADIDHLLANVQYNGKTYFYDNATGDGTGGMGGFYEKGTTLTATSTTNLREMKGATAVIDGETVTFDIIECKANNDEWTVNTGTYTVPQDQYLTRFFFVATISVADNLAGGNFIDDVVFSERKPYKVEYYIQDEYGGAGFTKVDNLDESALTAETTASATHTGATELRDYALAYTTVNGKTTSNKATTFIVAPPQDGSTPTLRLYYVKRGIAMTKNVEITNNTVLLDKPVDLFEDYSVTVNLYENEACTGDPVATAVIPFSSVTDSSAFSGTYENSQTVMFKDASGKDFASPANKTYYAKEAASELNSYTGEGPNKINNYTNDGLDKTITITTDENGIATASITNKYQKIETSDIEIEKQVTGNMGDWSKAFEFTIELVNNNVQPAKVVPFPAEFNVSGVTVAANRLSATFNLKHDQSINLTGIPVGLDLKITETNGEYTVAVKQGTEALTVTGSNGETTASAYINIGANKKVTFTNDYEVTIETGIALDSLPYILIIAIVVVGGAVLFLRKRKPQDD